MGEGRTEPTGGDRRDRQRLTVPEAAAVLGMTVDAVRGKVRRGTLDSEREGGTVYVYVDTDRRDPAPTVEGPSPDESPAALVEELRDRISYLERQVEEEREARRRADTILAQLSRANEEQARTIRALEAPPEPQNQAESGVEDQDEGDTTQEPERGAGRSLWRRLFGQ